MKEYIFVDTETTGLNAETDELLSISIIDHYGRCIFNSLVKPENKKSWDEAERINGISAEMVMKAPRFRHLKPVLSKLFQGKHVVAYNMAFDASFLGKTLRNASSLHCCMRAFAEYFGEIDPNGQDFKLKKLVFAVNECNPDFKFNSHTSLGDSLATREVWLRLMRYKSIAKKYGA
jgi:DNA polymerase-3 subunit epsilon